jgi:hypothetical protein
MPDATTTTRPAISLCAVCGQELTMSASLCAYHERAAVDSWAIENRIMCDFFHRGIPPRRLSVAECAEVATHAADAA